MRTLHALVLALSALALGCGTRCEDFTSAGGGMDVETNFGAERCSDEAHYAIRCLRPDPTGVFECKCTRSGAAGRRFSRRTNLPSIGGPERENAFKTANEECGWDLRGP